MKYNKYTGINTPTVPTATTIANNKKSIPDKIRFFIKNVANNANTTNTINKTEYILSP